MELEHVCFPKLGENKITSTRVLAAEQRDTVLIIACWSFIQILFPWPYFFFILFVCVLNPPVKYFTDRSKEVLLFVYHLCYLCLVSVVLSHLLIAALWSLAGKGLTSWLSCV